jgi:hypothetical protein
MKYTEAYPELLVLYSHINTHEIETVCLIASRYLDCSNAQNVSLMRGIVEKKDLTKKNSLTACPYALTLFFSARL